MPGAGSRRGLARLVVVIAAVIGPLWITTPPPQRAGAATRPNIVLVTTDDMSLADLRWMPQTRRLLEAGGVAVTDFIANAPLCCPSRAEVLTGQYGQNNGVHTNNAARWGGYNALVHRLNHVGAWLRSSGYRTAFVGKYLNGWEVSAPSDPGWSVFDPALRHIYSPYDLTMFSNGRPRRYPDTYTGDLVRQRTNRLIGRFARSGSPFFIWSSQVAPHDMNVGGAWVPPVPAPRHRGLYPRARPPSLSDPAFNEADVSDKPPWLRAHEEQSVPLVVALHRARIRSLQAVDEQVGSIVSTLRSVGALRRTYIFFTSDNGFMLGEHRLVDVKNVPYLQSLRVPLLVRGPGLPAGASRRAMYGMVDLAPTFLDLSGARPGRVLDGRSMMGTLRARAPGYGAYLIQAGSVDAPWWWRGVVTANAVYVRYADGFRELYDLRNDPAELQNVADDPAYRALRDRLARRLHTLSSCTGTACRSTAATRG